MPTNPFEPPKEANGPRITEADVMGLISEACPTFRSNETLLYIVLGEFARHLLELQKRGYTSCFPAVMQAIERLHVDSTPHVREAAIIGLLEGIQNTCLNAGIDPEVIGGLLLPESRRAWNELNNF